MKKRDELENRQRDELCARVYATAYGETSPSDVNTTKQRGGSTNVAGESEARPEPLLVDTPKHDFSKRLEHSLLILLIVMSVQ